ncbi:MAG: hypothetical protein A2V66_11905 [Ignavibacteria bacterium RBG_13_36_8]|nr:MAG: hypothetical protein A2V66_11905 [Ignavibacteria bacterium RBG_13_36_8]
MPIDYRLVRAVSKIKKRKGRLKRSPRWLYPFAIERKYKKELLNFVNDLQKDFNDTIGKFLDYMINQQKIDLPRRDAWTDDVDKLVEILSLKYDKLAKERYSAMTVNLGKSISKLNLEQWRKVTQSVFGIDLVNYEPWIGEMLKSFSKENVALIKSIKDKSLTNLEASIQRKIRTGTRVEVLQKEIKEEFNTTKSRARLIARDQIGKLNGQLTQLRQQEAGINSYIWRTALDERVRDEHEEREGQEFNWNDPPEGGHPGEDYQCRCYAEPNFNDIELPVGFKEI